MNHPESATPASPTPEQKPAVQEAQPASGREGLAGRAASGMRWSVSMTLLTRVLSLGNQVVLGWLLVESDYGRFAAVFAIFTLLSSVREGAMHRLIIQRGREFSAIVTTAHVVSGVINAAIAGLVMLAMALLAEPHQRGESLLMMAILAASLLVGPYTMTQRGKLAIDMRWRDTSKMMVAGSLGRLAVGIVLAALGAGPVALATAHTASLYAEALVLRLVARRSSERLSPFSWTEARSMLADARWLMAGGIGISLVLSGDYFVLGLLVDDRTLGAYFFGFQFTTPLMAVFQNGLNGVLLPALVKGNEDPNHLRRGTTRALRLISACMSPATLLVALTCPLLIHVIWQGRYDAAIPAAVLITLAGYFVLLGSVFYSVMEAKGAWRRRTLLFLATGVAVPVAAALGTWTGQATSLGVVAAVAAAVALARMLSTAACVVVGSRTAGLAVRPLLREMAAPSLALLASAAAGYAACWMLELAPESLTGAAVLLAAAAAVCVPVALLTFGTSIVAALQLLVPPRLLARVRLDRKPPAAEG